MAELMNNAIFWIDVDKIDANPYQPRKDFDEASLSELADSIKQYGVLQPLVLSRQERQKADGSGIEVRYELVAGERRTRAARLAGLRQVPAIIRIGDDSKLKLELAIIENLQREDLNPIDRARAFLQLVDEFGLTHAQVGKKMGKSREYVSNSIRLLSLPVEIIEGLGGKKISEGHTRPLLMLCDKPDEQMTLYKDIINRKMSVRESEKYARRIAHEKVRREHLKTDPQIMDLERKFSEQLGTRVTIETGGNGGKLVIDYGDATQLEHILEILKQESQKLKENLETPKFSPTDVGFAPAIIDEAPTFLGFVDSKQEKQEKVEQVEKFEEKHEEVPKFVEIPKEEFTPSRSLADLLDHLGAVEEIEKSYGGQDETDPEEDKDVAIAQSLIAQDPELSNAPEVEPEADQLVEESDIDDVEIDIVNDTKRTIPPVYRHMFNIPQ